MRSTKASPICWTGHKKMEELLDDPLAESLYGLFFKGEGQPETHSHKARKAHQRGLLYIIPDMPGL